MMNDELAMNRQKMQQMENVYNKTCMYCGKEFLGKNKNPFGICPQCEQEKYCDRCGQEINYYEYMANCGLCEECAEEIEYGDDI